MTKQPRYKPQHYITTKNPYIRVTRQNNTKYPIRFKVLLLDNSHQVIDASLDTDNACYLLDRLLSRLLYLDSMPHLANMLSINHPEFLTPELKKHLNK